MARNNKKKNSKNKKKQFSQLNKHLKEEIFSFLKKNQGKSYTVKQIAQATGLFDQVNNNKIRSVMDQLTESGKVAYLEKGRYSLEGAGGGQTMVGTLQVVKAGFGFLLVEQEEDVFIGPNNLGKAMDGDTVKVRLLSTRSKKGSRKTGEVVEVVQRSRTEFVGTVESVGHTHFMVSDDPRLQMDFYISEDKLGGAKNGEKVLARLIAWERRSPEVEVIRVIGKAGEHDTEMHAILFQYGFDPVFPEEVEAEARNIPKTVPNSELEKRRDMRDTLTFTIDPIDAKDFDDALSFKKLEEGRYEVGIHIADVSYYVKPGSMIDKEGFRRGTSVYLVDRTVPMLPETLSNELCSLRPNEDKLTYSAIFEMNDEGHVLKRWFGRTVIHSDYRFHYEEAEQVLKGETDGPFKEELDILNKIAYKLRDKRFASGSIDFDTPEIKFVLDENDKPVRVIKKIRGDSNRLIEDFMLLANREVAAHVAHLFSNPPLPFVYRVHDQPNPEKLASLQEFVKGFGYRVSFEDTQDTSETLNQLIHKVQGRPEQNVVESIAIRSMAKAVYTTHNIGHYGLGFKFYTHFTSPIRRYPDLMVHRLMAKYAAEEYKENPTILEEQCKHSSLREKTATEAERTSIKYKQVEFLEDKIGEEFTGIISGVIEAGIFVELDENLCEGMVPAWSIENDFYNYDQANYSLVGREKGQVLRMGDSVRVKIAGTDLKKRTIDMTLVEKLEPIAKAQ